MTVKGEEIVWWIKEDALNRKYLSLYPGYTVKREQFIGKNKEGKLMIPDSQMKFYWYNQGHRWKKRKKLGKEEKEFLKSEWKYS